MVFTGHNNQLKIRNSVKKIKDDIVIDKKIC